MHCSLSVRMKRSRTPLHSGSPTYEGEIVIPSHFTSLIQASTMYCGPQSQRILSPRATSLLKPPKACRTPLANRLERRPPVAELGDVPAEQLIGVKVDGPEEPTPAVLLGVEPRGIGAPHLVRTRRDDRPTVRGIPVGRPEPPRRQAQMLPHQPQHPLAAD